MFADLHIHSVLSPCADRTMIPPHIFSKIKDSGIDVFAICDHNSGWNVRAFYEFGKRFYPEIVIVPGIEITTKEEIHIVGLFPDIDRVETVSVILEDLLPEINVHPDLYFPQLVINHLGNTVRELNKPLYYATNLSLEETIELVRSHQGIAIAAHVDRPSFSIISQLGFIPENLFDIVEVSPICCNKAVAEKCIEMKGVRIKIPELLTIISSSDAHSLDEIGRVKTKLELDKYTFGGLVNILQNQPKIEVMEDD